MPRYSSTLVDHSRWPRNAGALEQFDLRGAAALQGSRLEIALFVKLEGSVVARASFEASGCGVATAAASMLTEMITGRHVDRCIGLTVEDVVRALNGIPADKRFCATLAIAALQDALRHWEDS